MAQIKTIDTVAGENQIDFKRRYPFVWLKNLGDADVYISDKAGIVAEADGVVLLGAGQAAMLENYDDCVYVLGATTIEAHGQHGADSPFGDTIVAGGGGGGGSAVIQSLSATENKTYNVPTGVDGFNPVVVNVPAPVLVEKTITQNGVYDPEDDNADGYSMIDVEVAPNVSSKSININGTYTAASENLDGYSSVTVEVPETTIESLSVTQNGTYTAISGKAFSPVTVDVYEKYNELFRWNGWSTSGNYETLAKPISTTDYDEFWMVGHYAFNSDKGYNALWNSRFPTSIIFDTPSAWYGVFGSDNYLWSHVYANSVEQEGQYGYCYPCMYIGVKNKDREQELLWQNSSYDSAPSTIELSGSIFDYDEICLYFVNVTAGSHHATVWYPTSQLNINDTVYVYNDYDGAICKYAITANDTLSVVSEAVYTLYAVYGIKDNSMQETVLFTNPSDSTMPATVTLSDAYTNYDEIVLVGHISGETTKGAQYYPVKALTGFDEMNLTQRVGIFTDTTNCWLSITSDTTLVPDSASTGVIVDKIIGIKRPVVGNAEPLPVKYIDDNKGIICYDNSSVSPIGFKNTDELESSYISMPTDTAVTVEFCGVVSTDDTYGRIWQMGTYNSVGNTFAYDNSGSSPMFELAIHDSWDTHQIDATDYLDTLITLSIVIDSDTKVYINGTLVSNAITFTKSDIVSDENEIRFLHGTTSSRAADGDIYAFRIYHRALTQAEIQQNVQADIYNFGSTTVISE